jgi:AcrR family transcriptional regulator
MSADRPQRSAKARLREVRATLIMDAAEEVFIEKGYHEASMDEIAARAGVAKGTLYQHFPGKEDLVFALIERALDLFAQAVEQAAAASNLTARAKLERILRYVYQDLRGVHILLQLLSQNVELRVSMQEKKVWLHERLENSNGQLRKIIEDGKAEGTFNPTLSTGLMLSAFFNMLMLTRQERFTVGEQLSTEELVTQVGLILFEGFCR